MIICQGQYSQVNCGVEIELEYVNTELTKVRQKIIKAKVIHEVKLLHSVHDPKSMCYKHCVQNNKVEGQSLLECVRHSGSALKNGKGCHHKKVLWEWILSLLFFYHVKQSITPILPFDILLCKGTAGRSHERPEAKAFILDFPASGTVFLTNCHSVVFCDHSTKWAVMNGNHDHTYRRNSHVYIWELFRWDLKFLG